jgi:hypothetical protein
MLKIVSFAKKVSMLMMYVYPHAVTATNLGALVCTLALPTNARYKVVNKNLIYNGDCHLDLYFQNLASINSPLQLCLVSPSPN